MKTAISIPDDVFESAEKLAHRLGKSRSQLYAQALSSYLATNDEEVVEAALNEVYKNIPSNLDPSLGQLQAKSIINERW